MHDRRTSPGSAPQPVLAGGYRRAASPVQAKLFRGLAEPVRLAILARLDEGSCSAGQLAVECGLTPSNASNHLRCLLGCGLVSLERRGRRRVYSLTDRRVGQLIRLSAELLASPVGELIGCCSNYRAEAESRPHGERSTTIGNRPLHGRPGPPVESRAGDPSTGGRVPKQRREA